MLHNWCFPTKGAKLEAFGTTFEVSIFTDTNRYDIDESSLTKENGDSYITFSSSSLIFAGGQCSKKGDVVIRVKKDEKERISFEVEAECDEEIRKVKITLFDQPFGEVIGRRRYNVTPSETGVMFNYPNGWDDLFTPLIAVPLKNKKVNYYRFLDNIVRPKHFALIKRSDELMSVEMVYEEDARIHTKKLIAKGFEIGSASSIEEIFEDQRVFIEKAFSLSKWEERKDVPSWAKKMSLMVNLHGMHWSGFIFNTYKQMEEKLDWLKDRCDPSSTCIYIPGFDGRYYYQYPHYDPDPRMGGEEGLKHLVNYAHSLGFHIMPMFMSNGGNPNLYKDFADLMDESRYHSRNGYVGGVGSCDWDTGRGYDLGCGVAVNPGAPKWQDFFVDEVSKQVEKYGFDGIFLDLAAIYWNDPFYSTHEGAKAIIDRLHEKFSSLLIATEGCYDALSICFPLSQCAGEGSRGLEMIYHDTPYAPLFDTYNRCVGHLCLGAPGNMKNGVFESGFNYAETRMPIRKGIIPTLTLVDDTIEKYPNEVEDIISDSKKYKELFIERDSK